MYKDKHNEANGEGNRDGDNNNLSDNYGVEGPTRRKAISELRARQIKNMLSTLLLSQGVPMIVAGDECRRTQQGNNNAYCQDNPISWFDWRLVRQNRDLVRFVAALNQFRRAQATVRRKHYLTGRADGGDGLPDVAWFAPNGHGVDWQSSRLALVCLLSGPRPQDVNQQSACDLLLLFNSTPDPIEYVFPEVARKKKWRLFLNTANPSPSDIYPDLDGPSPVRGRVTLTYRSFAAYVAK